MTACDSSPETWRKVRAELLRHEHVQDAVAKLGQLRADVGQSSMRYVAAVLGTEACLGGVFDYGELDQFASMKRLPVGERVDQPGGGVEAPGTVGDYTVWFAAGVLAGRLQAARDGSRRIESDAERKAVSRVLREAVGPTANRHHINLMAKPVSPAPGLGELGAKRLAATKRKRLERQRRRTGGQAGRWDETQCRDYVAGVASWYEHLGLDFYRALSAGLEPPTPTHVPLPAAFQGDGLERPEGLGTPTAFGSEPGYA